MRPYRCPVKQIVMTRRITCCKKCRILFTPRILMKSTHFRNTCWNSTHTHRRCKTSWSGASRRSVCRIRVQPSVWVIAPIREQVRPSPGAPIFNRLVTHPSDAGELFFEVCNYRGLLRLVVPCIFFIREQMDKATYAVSFVSSAGGCFSPHSLQSLVYFPCWDLNVTDPLLRSTCRWFSVRGGIDGRDSLGANHSYIPG